MSDQPQTASGAPDTESEATLVKPRPRHKSNKSIDPSSIDTATLHMELHQATSAKADEKTVIEKVRRTVMKHTGAIGVGYITNEGKNADGITKWDLHPSNTTGRLPRRHDFVEKFAESCSATVQRDTIQLEHFLGVQAIYSPVKVAGDKTDVMLVLTDDMHTTGAVFVLEIVNAYLGLYLKTHRSKNNDWKLVSLAALIELISQIESEKTIRGACDVAANELLRYLGAKQVAVGFLQRGQMVVHALSGTLELDTASDTYHGLETALSESVLRDGLGVYPPRENDATHLLVAHKQLCADLQTDSVMTSPLVTPEGKTVGAIMVAGEVDHIQSDKLTNFVRASAPRVASALEVVSRAQLSRIQQLVHKVKTASTTMSGKTWAFVGVIALAIMLFPVRYRVRCNCTTEPTLRRYAVAPFQGLIEKGFAKPGDTVEQGQLLARMDGQAIRWELASVLAQQQQAAKKREIELADRNVTASLLSQLESERLTAKTRLLQHQQDQVTIRSPIDGIVLAGSLERTQAAAVDTGEVVYEIAPLDEMRFEITVPADEISHVSKGQSVRIWVNGMSGQSYTGTIDRINPQSELREGKNVFVAIVTLPNTGDMLRPGMTGSVRIDCARHPLVWNVFRRPWDYLASRLTWW